MTAPQENAFPTSGFVRLPQIIGNPKAKPPIPPFIPVGRSTWWHWVKIGQAPAPVKLGPRATAWRAEQILAFAESFGVNPECK
jgi:prophage regulatory protein